MLGIGKSNRAESSTVESVGPELLKVLPQLDRPWYRTRHLLLLNMMLLVPLFSSAAVGYDGKFLGHAAGAVDNSTSG